MRVDTGSILPAFLKSFDGDSPVNGGLSIQSMHDLEFVFIKTDLEVSGRVVNQSGLAAGGVKVHASSVDGRWGTTTSNAEGEFVFYATSAKWTLTTFDPRGGTTTPTVVDVDAVNVDGVIVTYR